MMDWEVEREKNRHLNRMYDHHRESACQRVEDQYRSTINGWSEYETPRSTRIFALARERLFNDRLKLDETYGIKRLHRGSATIAVWDKELSFQLDDHLFNADTEGRKINPRYPFHLHIDVPSDEAYPAMVVIKQNWALSDFVVVRRQELTAAISADIRIRELVSL